MADIQVRIKLNAGVDGDQINSVAFNQKTNNVSKAVGSKTTQNAGQNLISWGNVVKDSDGNVVSKVINGEVVTTGLLSLADGYVGGANSTLSSQGGYNGFVFGVVPESKAYSVEVTLEGANIDSVTFYGDRKANQFPTRAIVNGEYIYSDDAEWTIVFPSASNTQTITFDMWNRVNYNACFTHIGIFVDELVLDKKWIKSVESLSQSTGQPKEIYYGVTPSSGSIEIIDRNSEIKDYLQDGILDISNTHIDIYCNNDEQKLISHISNDGEYLQQNKTLSLVLQDKFDLILNNKYVGRKLSAETNAYNVISSLLSDMGYNNHIDSMLGENIIVSVDGIDEVMSVKDYLSQIVIPYPYLEESTYREALEKFCVLAQLNMIKKDGAEIPIFVSARPIIMSYYPIIKIPQGNVFGDFKTDVVVKNKIQTVSCEYRDISYDFGEIANNTVQIFDTSSGASNSYSDLNSKRVLNNNKHNSGFVVLRERVQDTYSYTDNSLNRYYYSIIKISTAEKINIDLDYMRFKLSANVNIINPNSSPIYSTTQQWIEYTDEEYPDIDIKDYTKTDAEIVNSWLHSRYGTFSGSNLEMIVRINQNQTADFFVAFLETIQLASNTNTVIRLIDNYSMSFSVKNISYINVNKIENADIEIKSNELLQNDTLYKGKRIIDIIQDNILNDYSNGVKTGNLTISCSDYFNLDGTLAKDWSKGEVLRVGDLLKVDKDNTIWRVTGRNFRKVGVPMIDLELQEVRVVG